MSIDTHFSVSGIQSSRQQRGLDWASGRDSGSDGCGCRAVYERVPTFDEEGLDHLHALSYLAIPHPGKSGVQIHRDTKETVKIRKLRVRIDLDPYGIEAH